MQQLLNQWTADFAATQHEIAATIQHLQTVATDCARWPSPEACQRLARIAVEDGMRIAVLSAAAERIDTMRRALEAYIATHKTTV